MSKEIIAQLKHLKKTHEGMNPNPEWVVRSREQLMAQIQNSMGNNPEHASFSSSFETFLKLFISQRAYYGLRTALVFVLAIGITVGGWIGGVSASHHCLPGDFCYNVKLAAEKTQVVVASLTGSTDTKVALHLEFASRRLEEIRQVKTEHQVHAVNGLKKSLNSVSDTLAEAKDQDPETATRVAKDVTKKTSDIAQTLSDVTASDINVPIDTVKAIADATQAANDTGIQALEIAIAGQPTGTPSDDIKALVQQKIDTIMNGSKDSQETVHEVKNSVDATFASSTLDLSTSSPVVQDTLSTSTMQITTSTLDISVEKVDATVIQAQVVADEATALLNGNKVDEAFEKVKTLNSIVNGNSQDVVQAQEAAGPQVVPPPLTTTTQDITISSSTTQ